MAHSRNPVDLVVVLPAVLGTRTAEDLATDMWSTGGSKASMPANVSQDERHVDSEQRATIKRVSLSLTKFHIFINEH